MEMKTSLKVSFDKLVKPDIEPATLSFQGEWFIHYTIMAPIFLLHHMTLHLGVI